MSRAATGQLLYALAAAVVVALAATSELLRSASSNVLRFKIDSELPKVLADKARITGRIVQFPAHNAFEIEQYLGAVREAGLHAEDIEIRKADLEDVFLNVMAGKPAGVAPLSASAEGPEPDEADSAVREAASMGVL